MLPRLNTLLVIAAMLCSCLSAVMDIKDEMSAEQIGATELENNGTAEEVPFGRTLFLLHLLKQKLHKLHQLDRIPTTSPPFLGCLCVPFYLCDNNNTIINDGSGVIDLRYRRCTGDLEVCCFLRASTIVVYPPTLPPTLPPVTLPTTPPTTRPPVTVPTTPPTTRPPVTVPTTPPTTRPPVTVPTTPPTTRPPVTVPTTPPTTRPPVTVPTTPPTTRPPITLPTTPPTILPPVPLQPILYCTCVPVYQCALYSGGGNVYGGGGNVYGGGGTVDGTGIINPRQQLANTCIGAFVCCNYAPVQVPVVQFPTPAPTFPPFTLPIPLTTTAPVVNLPPIIVGQSCVCTLLTACNIGYYPITGVGNIDPRLILGRQGQPAGTCSTPNSMCCPLSQPSPVVPQTNIVSSNIIAGDVKYPGTANACTCIPADQCADGNAVTYDGVGAIDPRFGPCSSATLVCCRLLNRQRTDVVIGISTGQNPVYVNPPTAIVTTGQQSPVTCGLRDTTYASLTQQVAGTAYFAEFPWMSLLLIRKTGSSDVFQCGGSLINSRTIMTAAHCVVNCDPGTLVARVGEWNTLSTNEPLPFQEVPAQRIVVHPQFFGGGLYHDVALVILSRPVTYAINVRPVCLPTQGQVFAAGTLCYASGWGRSAFGEGGAYQTILRKVDLPIIDNASCQTRLRGTRLGQFFQLHPSFICAGGEASKDTCYKDGGGPLVCQDQSGRFTQSGIISWGIGCGSNAPAVYANVAQHRQWIDQTLLLNGINN